MANHLNFEHLVAGLLADERKDLLEKLRAGLTTKLDDEVQWSILAEAAPVSWEESLERMGFFHQLWVRVVAMFSGLPLKQVVEQDYLKHLEKEISAQVPGFFHFRSETLGTPFFQELKILADALKPLRLPLAAAMDGQRLDFIAFHSGLVLSDLQARVILETDCWQLLEKNPDLPTKDIKNLAERNFNTILSEIPPETRKALYQEFQGLHNLWRLSQLNFEPLLAAFSVINNEGQPDHAPFRLVKTGLEELYFKLATLPFLPSLTALQAVFVFYQRDQLEGPPGELEAALEAASSKAMLGLRRIGETMRRVPFSKIICRLKGFMNLPAPTAGGMEDWFVQLRRFWETKMERDYQRFARYRSEKILTAEVLTLLGAGLEEWLRAQPYPVFPEAYVTHGNKTLGFVRLFWEKHFQPRIRPLLLVLLQEGDFYKKVDREDLSQVLAGLEKVAEVVTDFSLNFGFDGVWGALLEGLEELPEDGRRARIEEVFLMAADTVDGLWETWTPLFRKTGDLLKNFAQGDPAGKRDLVSNLPEIGGRSNAAFRRELELSATQWGRFFLLFKDLGQFD